MPEQIDPEITLKLPLSAVNFLISTADRNPLGGSVMQVSNLINSLRKQAGEQVAVLAAGEEPNQ